MSLLPAYYTTLNLKKQKSKSVTQETKLSHEQWLRSQGVHPDQLKARKKRSNKTLSSQAVPKAPDVSAKNLMALGPTGLKREEQRYTGREIIGISQMHKSNAVPVRNKTAAADIAKMRRG
jgi:Tat protein secretion system quality control protein TatD with DNase activity